MDKSKEYSFVAALKEFFGYREGQNAGHFAI